MSETYPPYTVANTAATQWTGGALPSTYKSNSKLYDTAYLQKHEGWWHDMDHVDTPTK